MTESGRAASISNERFRVQGTPDQASRRGPTELVIFSNPSLNVDDPRLRSMVERVTEPLAALPDVASLESYYDTDNPDLVSDDGNAVLMVVEITPGGSVAKIDTVMDAVRVVDKEADDFQIAMTGNIDEQQDRLLEEDFARILLVSLGLGLVILVIAFRSLVAAVVPLILAIWAIGSALGFATVVSQEYALVDVYTEIVLLMGLAVGIDYSLFILSRFRFERSPEVGGDLGCEQHNGPGGLVRGHHSGVVSGRPHADESGYLHLAVPRCDHRRPYSCDRLTNACDRATFHPW